MTYVPKLKALQIYASGVKSDFPQLKAAMDNIIWFAKEAEKEQDELVRKAILDTAKVFK